MLAYERERERDLGTVPNRFSQTALGKDIQFASPAHCDTQKKLRKTHSSLQKKKSFIK